jgi:uncharacterized protein (TIGR00251 family)
VIVINESANGLILPVRAQPNGRKNAIKGEHAGSLKVVVTAPPEDGRANEAVVEVLREVLGLKRSQIQLLSGATSREKKVLITGLTKVALENCIESICQ